MASEESLIASLKEAVATLENHFNIGGGWGPWEPESQQDIRNLINIKIDPGMSFYIRHINGKFEISKGVFRGE